MIKTLIIDDNLKYSKDILNKMLCQFKDIQVLYMASTYQESIDIISKNQIDLIFLDLRLPDYNGTKIIENIQYMDCLKIPKIVIMSGDSELLGQVIMSNNICEIIRKVDSYDSMYEKIKRVIYNINYETNSKNIEEFILTEILNFGFKLKYKGTQYIMESIKYIYKTNNFQLLDNLEQNVYKFIGFKYKKSINNIKTNIIKATNRREKERNKLYSLTPKQTIITILNKIRITFN